MLDVVYQFFFFKKLGKKSQGLVITNSHNLSPRVIAPTGEAAIVEHLTGNAGLRRTGPATAWHSMGLQRASSPI